MEFTETEQEQPWEAEWLSRVGTPWLPGADPHQQCIVRAIANHTPILDECTCADRQAYPCTKECCNPPTEEW